MGFRLQKYDKVTKFSVTVSTNAQSKETSQTGEKKTYCQQELLVSSGTNKIAH